jgi:hypothetical protein
LIRILEVKTADEIEQAFSAIARDDFDGAIVVGPSIYDERARVGASAMAHKIPTIGIIAEQVPYNLLLSYGPDLWCAQTWQAQHPSASAPPHGRPAVAPAIGKSSSVLVSLSATEQTIF